MKRTHLFLSLSLLSSVFASSGCSKNLADLQALASANSAVRIVDASIGDCPAGGVLVETFLDSNFNGVKDEGETLVTSKKVCSGQTGSAGETGAQGIGAGIEISVAPSGACPAGGQVLTTFSDSSNDGARDVGEAITSVSTLCNGLIGETGAAGASAHLTVTAASLGQCTAGGVVYSSFVGGESPTLTVVCNGTNGTNGTNGNNGQNAVFQLGAVGPAVVGKAYSACHHDYLYIPGDEHSAGWLTFRHQKNGSADQGIGATGFQVWNVDISDFGLASEVGGVTYCSLHWDPVTRVLNYTVVDNSDGLAGMSGTIELN